MLNRLTDTLDFQAQSLLLRSQRQQLLASNIANADTPGYVARDLDFASALRAATGSSAAAPLAATSAGHMSLQGGLAGAGGANTAYTTTSQDSLDHNTVDMDRERATFADNTVHYEATLRFLNGGVRTLLSAITGQ